MINTLYFQTPCELSQAKVFQAMREEKEKMGYYHLPTEDILDILDYKSKIPQKIKNIVVIGIGGSSLGAKAIYEFIRPVKKLSRKLYFFESTDPISIANLSTKLDFQETHFLVISKSGQTIETLAIYKYIYALHTDPTAYTFITEKDSPLDKYAQSIHAKIFYLAANVGGRFSVLSVVGLLPLNLVGIDIQEILDGAKMVKESFFQHGYMKETMLKKAVYYAQNHDKYRINCIFAYSETLKYFCEWYVQLWGESLGKKQQHADIHVGLTPIGLIGPKDQHSFLQLLMEGSRDKSITFIKIEDFPNDITIPEIPLEHLESLDALHKLSFASLINMQCDATLESLQEEAMPLDMISLPCVDEKNIGALLYYYELLTSMIAHLLDVNAYNQPGVEKGKNLLTQKLNRS